MTLKKKLLIFFIFSIFCLPLSFAAGVSENEGEIVYLSALIRESSYTIGVQQMVEKLKNDNIIISVEPVPDSQLINILNLRFAAGNAPDLIEANVYDIYRTFNPTAHFFDLSQEEWVQNLITPKAVQYTNEKIYGFPFASTDCVYGFIYNKDIFNKYKISVPTSWAELLTACDALIKRNPSIIPIFIGKDTDSPKALVSDIFTKKLEGQDLNFFADQTLSGKISWAENKSLEEGIDLYLQIFKRGFVNRNFGTATKEEAIKAMAEGRAAMYFGKNTTVRQILQANTAANIGMFSVSVDGKGNFITGDGKTRALFVNKKTIAPLSIKKALNILSGQEMQNIYYYGIEGFPAFRKTTAVAIPPYLEHVFKRYIEGGKIEREFVSYFLPIEKILDATLFLFCIEDVNVPNINGKTMLLKFDRELRKHLREKQ
ncbi:carbohydrate ABC transporter substrate-binding protein [Treponema phagedenis]|uniref:ABC transporter, solute-binding protein n=1 Tax=Treponema phagedenis TaxID=162 RepID=A0A0B7H1U7_TREPH|nr:ABC transporter substrate-binding protein [Treponema phagedenis]NVP23671.1 carbohydrate ABC transporter substrate-binding protein [Treponema phagedenis]QEJ94496.1 carbohydrate ABC transporter substrate-binding protein [Treponema phagedenis]QEJ98795.1 carbohydrate ABC transporter substrate-binding protein [Treponema phagedenis]QEK01622.1 carbohydrate ABC transporter substrate-binding protein [Treponema phagedenis]QEK04300.1 carbohydrate ABC transporter substrate-binding protein [Treponema ph